MPAKGPIQSTSHIIQTPSFDPLIKEPSEAPVQQQTATGDSSQHNAIPMDQRAVDSTDATSNVNPKATQIESLKSQYKKQLSHKAKLEEKQTLARSVKPIRQSMKQPPKAIEDCEFMIFFESSDGKRIRVIPPQAGVDKTYLEKLKSRLGIQLEQIEAKYGEEGKNLETPLENIQSEIAITHQKLSLLAVSHEELSASEPEQTSIYELIAEDIPSGSWSPIDDSGTEKFVMELLPPKESIPKESVQQVQQKRAALSGSIEPQDVDPEPHRGPFGLELPVEIETLTSDLAGGPPELFPLSFDKKTPGLSVSRASVITGGPDLKLPVEKSDALSLIPNPNVFETLHKKLQSSYPEEGACGLADPIQILAMGTDSPIRQCFCYRGSAGTAFVHVFMDAFDKKPGKNKNNQFMVLWYPNNAEQQESAVMAKNAGHEIVKAVHKYNEYANSYNTVFLETELKAWSKTSTEPKPVPLPTAKTIRFCALPHETQTLSSSSVNLDNETMAGISEALTEIQDKPGSQYFKDRSIKTLEIPEHLNPEIDSQKPDGPENEHEEVLIPEGKRLAQRITDLTLFDDKAAKKMLESTQEYLNKRQGASAPTTSETSRLSHTPAFKTVPLNVYNLKKEEKEEVALIFHLEGQDHSDKPMNLVASRFVKQLTDHLKNHDSLNDITDTEIMNIIYCIFFSNPLPDINFSINLYLNEKIWVINRGDIRTLCISHDNPEAREVQADNSDPTIAKQLADVIYRDTKIDEDQKIEYAKNLPAITKLPLDNYPKSYITTAFGININEVVKIVRDKVEGKSESQSEDIKEEIGNRLNELYGAEGIEPPLVLATF